jgi:hypothetical protein
MKRIRRISSRVKTKLDKKAVSVMAVAGFVAVAGSIFVISKAAGPFVAAEPELGTKTAPVMTISDTTASGGQSVKFSAPTTGGVPQNTCLNPVFTTSNTNGGWSNGGYYVHNNMWNANSGETLYACSYKSWYVDASGYTGTAVKTYPNVHLDLPNAFTTGVPFNNYSTITSTFGGKGPGKGIYNVAYDLWLNGVGWGGGTTEVMIWTEYLQQRPLGSIKTTYTAGGITYDVWHYNDGDANVVSYVARGDQYTGNLDIKALVNFGISRGYIPPNPSLNQMGYGIEFCDTAGTARFYVTDFSITLN